MKDSFNRDFYKAYLVLQDYNRAKWNKIPPKTRQAITNRYLEYRNLLVEEEYVKATTGFNKEEPEEPQTQQDRLEELEALVEAFDI